MLILESRGMDVVVRVAAIRAPCPKLGAVIRVVKSVWEAPFHPPGLIGSHALPLTVSQVVTVRVLTVLVAPQLHHLRS